MRRTFRGISRLYELHRWPRVENSRRALRWVPRSLQLWQRGAAAGPAAADVWEALSATPAPERRRVESGKGSGGYGSSSDDSASDDDCPPVPPPAVPKLVTRIMALLRLTSRLWRPRGRRRRSRRCTSCLRGRQGMDGAPSAAAAFSTTTRAAARRATRLAAARRRLQLGDLGAARYTRWKACVQKVARARAVEGGDAQGLRVVVLEVGSSFSSPPEISGSVRRESEAFVASLNASGRGKNVATLVRVSEDYPLPERREGEGLAEEAVIPILMSATSALTAIDSELGHLEARRG